MAATVGYPRSYVNVQVLELFKTFFVTLAVNLSSGLDWWNHPGKNLPRLSFGQLMAMPDCHCSCSNKKVIKSSFPFKTRNSKCLTPDS